MTRDHEQDSGRTAEELKALRAVRDMRYPEADNDLRARARAAFLSGSKTEGESRPAGTGDDTASRPAETKPEDIGQGAPKVIPIPPRPGSSRLVRWGSMAAVILIGMLGGMYGSAPKDAWTVTDVVARHGVNLEAGCGNPGEHVHEGRVAVSDTSEFEFQLGQDLRLRLLAGTELELPSPPGRWFDRDRTLVIHSGEVYGTTSGPLGYRIRLETPEASATLTGTTFAVFRTDDATCFCLWDGELAIRTAAGDDVTLPAGRRVFVYADGRDPREEPLTDMEKAKLSMMSEGGMMSPLPVHP